MTLARDERNRMFDQILSQIEAKLREIKNELELPGGTLERWPGGEPAVSLAWAGPDLSSRNVNGLILSADHDNNTPSQIVIEANAWRDVDSPDGKTRNRLWRRCEFGELDVTEPVESMRWDKVKAFEADACRAVLEWVLHEGADGVESRTIEIVS